MEAAGRWLPLRPYVDGKIAAREEANCCLIDPAVDVISTDELAVHPAEFGNLANRPRSSLEQRRRI